MDSSRRFVCVLAAACLAGWSFAADGRQDATVSPSLPLQNLAAFLPQKAELQAWRAEKAPRIFKGEDLYLFIDGGAEIYHEYGFRQVLVQDYRSASGRSLTLEIFEMANSPAAFGVYTFKSSGKGKALTIGQDGQLEDYYLNYWKGNVEVTLTGADGSQDIIQGLLLIAKSVEKKIKSQGARPLLIEVLPKDGFPKSRLKYVKGVLGLQNIDPSLGRWVLGFNEGVVGTSEDEKSICALFRFSSLEECRRRFQAAKAALEKSAEMETVRDLRPDLFALTDAKGKATYAQTFEDCLALIITKDGQGSALRILALLRDNFKKVR